MAGLRGRTFGGYQLVEQLPGGGIADVYRGRPTKAGGRDAVVKVIYPEFAHQPGFLPHFRQIVASSGKLSSHPHVLPLLASGEDSGYLYLITPYVEAGSLRDWMRKGGRMGVGDVAPFFRQLCDALTYAHSLSVVHGNLKPSNIFLYEGRHVLVGDFGLLWDISHLDMNHAGSGTEAVEFLAPEVLSGQVTQLSDIYSIGALLFAVLTGRAPFQAATPAEVFAAAARQLVPHLAQANPALPAPAQALDGVIQKAMAKRPEERFPSAAAVAQSIETSAHQAASSALVQAPGGDAGAPFAPVSGPMPFGSMALPPQNGPAAYPGLTGTPGMPGMPGAAFPAPAMSLAQAAAAIGSGAVSSLARLDPPFPPLPTAAKPEAQMEQARIGGMSGTGRQPAVRPSVGASPFSESTARMAAPAVGGVPLRADMRVPAQAPPDVPPQPTMHVPAPAPALPMNPMSPNAGQQPGPGIPPSPPGFDAPPESRAARISGAPRARLGRAAPSPTLDDDDEDFAPLSMPAVHPPAGPSGPNGFAVAGGTGSFDPGARGMSAPQNGGFSQTALPGSAALDAGNKGNAGALDSMTPDRPGYAGPSGANDSGGRYGESGLLDDASAGYPGFAGSTVQSWGEPRVSESEAYGGGSDGYTGEQHGYGGGYDSSQGGAGWGKYNPEEYTGEYSGQLASDSGGYGSGNGYTGEYGAQYSGDLDSHYPADGRPFSATQLGLPRLTSPALMEQPPSWQEILADSGGLPGGMAARTSGAPNAAGERAPSWQDAGESMWQPAVQAPPRQESPMPQHVEAEWMGTGIPGSWGAPPAESAGKRKKGKRAKHDEPEDSGFDDDRVWTVGTTAVRPRRRWPRKLALLMLFIILIDLAALLVLRPDLCPNQSCRALSASLRQHLGLTQNTPATPSFTTIPSSITLTVAAGKSASPSLTVNNATRDNAAWKASVGLSWITVNPTNGTLAANSAVALTLTAKPTGIKAGTYKTSITITLTGATPQTVTIPVTIKVTS